MPFGILGSLLDGMGFNSLPRRLGAQGLFTPTFTPTRLVSNVVMFFIMLTATTAAVNTLGTELHLTNTKPGLTLQTGFSVFTD